MVNTQNRTKSEDTSWWGGEEQGITLQLINLPITTTIKLHIHHVDMEMELFMQDNQQIKTTLGYCL